jgi:uncharacterized protein
LRERRQADSKKDTPLDKDIHTQFTDSFRILSLDGGGVRGLLTSRILENIEEYLTQSTSRIESKPEETNRTKQKLPIPLGQHFDLIVGTSIGTSTGGLIALALANGKPASERIKG